MNISGPESLLGFPLSSIPLTIHISTEVSLNFTPDHFKPFSFKSSQPVTLPENSCHVAVHTPLSLFTVFSRNPN